MKVAIATLGRFHVLDLARELDRLGVDTTFYSYVPPKRGEMFGLPKTRQRSVLAFVAPLVAWQGYAPNFQPALLERAMTFGLNAAVRTRLEPCDVFVCMSGAYLEAAIAAKRRFGAQVWLERGSRHILSQREILKELGGTRGPTDFIVARELAGYELADRIVVPASQVVESFLEKAPHLAGKLFVDPYGVDLEQFPQRPAQPVDGPVTAIFVGAWSRRKGVDVLADAVRSLENVRLLHVGGLADAPFPTGDSRFEHVDSVPQWRLKEFYARAHVFALASREEGLALVQPQALASGLPLVCTTRTGGADLKLSPALAARIEVTEPNDSAAFAGALKRSLARSLPPLADADRQLLSWAAYGRRYFDELKQTLGRSS
jgi:alpha-maltose-1-phosphate synthase